MFVAALGLWLWQGENVLQRLWRLSEPVRYWINYRWTIGNFPFSVATLTLGLLTMLAAVLVSRYLRRFIERRMATHKHLDPGVQFTILRLVHYFVILVGGVLALRIAGAGGFPPVAALLTAALVG